MPPKTKAELSAEIRKLRARVAELERRAAALQRTRKPAEGQLERQDDTASQRERLAALGNFAAGIAHELKNPIGILSFWFQMTLEKAKTQPLPAEVLEDLPVLYRYCQGVARTAQRLLAFARQLPLERRPVDLNAVVEETVLLAQHPMTEKGIRITTALDRTLQPILGDFSALQQVVLNLLINAREAITGGGEVRIETGLAPDRPGWLRLVISDTGPGIPTDELTKIFQPFHTTKAEGTGLGLWVSQGIVRDHQGTLRVQSVPGTGTTFSLSFPAVSSQ